MLYEVITKLHFLEAEALVKLAAGPEEIVEEME